MTDQSRAMPTVPADFKLGPVIGGILGRRIFAYATGALAMYGGLNMAGDSPQAMAIAAVASAVGTMIVDLVWSFWQKIGQRYLVARYNNLMQRFEVATVAIEMQNQKMEANGVTPPSAAAIANAIPDPKVTAEVVAQSIPAPAT